jgi:hypothetical protein
MPGFLEEIGIKPIRPRGLVIRQFLYYTADFILAKRNAKVVNFCKEYLGLEDQTGWRYQSRYQVFS